MISVWEQQLKALQQQLELIVRTSLPFPVATELCYREAEKALQKMEQDLLEFPFVEVEDEVFAHKIVLPKFIAEKEYYRLINYANGFCPEGRRDQLKFWNLQQDRLLKFKLKHAAFIEYEANGAGLQDKIYYARHHEQGYPILKGLLLARERFANWAAQQLEAMG